MSQSIEDLVKLFTPIVFDNAEALEEELNKRNIKVFEGADLITKLQTLSATLYKENINMYHLKLKRDEDIKEKLIYINNYRLAPNTDNIYIASNHNTFCFYVIELV